VDTREVETTSVDRTGMRYFVDEYGFTPYKARVHAGDKVLFVNNGSVRHEIVALDGSWGTGPLSPTQEASVGFSKPGEYTYRCKDHPWAYGRILVEPDGQSESGGTDITQGAETDPDGIAGQAMRGRALYNKDCSACHGEDLSGRAPAPALSGGAFLSHWQHATVGELLDRIRTTMPQVRPGNLARTAYLDIVAYLLRANDIVSVSSAIQDDPQSLSSLTIETR
jgi:plastocyanin